MSKMGISIPPGFTIICEGCAIYYNNNKVIPREMESEIMKNLDDLEKLVGKRLGDKDDPLLVSVRSGAEISMPGMMDTILNLGLNDQTVLGLAKKTNNMRFALDSYRRFIHMFGATVKDIPAHSFAELLNRAKK